MKQLKELVSINSANEKARGDAQAYKIKSAKMQAYQNIDTEKLRVMSMSGMAPESSYCPSNRKLNTRR